MSVSSLLRSSKHVFLDAQTENGAIVAANTDSIHYPKEVSNYHFVWPRDVAFTLYASRLLGITKLQRPFLQWLLTRAEGFSKSGVIYQRYATNGARDAVFGLQWQPDQAGSMLWSVLSQKSISSEGEEVVQLLCDGLLSKWRSSQFTEVVHDLWEERDISNDAGNTFSYTLAACSRGLQLAANRFDNKKWLAVSEQMAAAITSCPAPFYSRVCSNLDENADASVLGLFWPFDVVDIDDKTHKTLTEIESRLLTPQGIMRYEHDVYDGVLDHTKLLNQGAGGWPLLTYWYLIALSKIGKRAEAKKLFDSYTSQFSKFIPEQVHAVPKPSITPLCWSHAMFVIAAKELGYF